MYSVAPALINNKLPSSSPSLPYLPLHKVRPPELAVELLAVLHFTLIKGFSPSPWPVLTSSSSIPASKSSLLLDLPEFQPSPSLAGCSNTPPSLSIV